VYTHAEPRFVHRQWRPEATAYAMREFDHGDRRFAAGDEFPWRELGLHVDRAREFHRACFIDTPEPATAMVGGEPPVKMTAGPRVTVETPAQQRDRRKERR
jgi:hypothetical protein